jgi:hypothetical protein
VTLRLFPLDPTSYRSHPIHSGERIWPESNCYVDLWTELLHSAGFEPMGAMAFTIGVDLEGDQWTFVKFPLADLYDLYGVDVIELNIWRPLIDHVEEQLRSALQWSRPTAGSCLTPGGPPIGRNM